MHVPTTKKTFNKTKMNIKTLFFFLPEDADCAVAEQTNANAINDFRIIFFFFLTFFFKLFIILY